MSSTTVNAGQVQFIHIGDTFCLNLIGGDIDGNSRADLLQERGSMNGRRFAAILSIDVVGYSRLMQLDASGLLKSLNKIFRDILKPTVAEGGGRIVKLLGDGALVEFPATLSALSTAVGIQQKMSAYPWLREAIQLRVGVHAGDVLVEGNDLFGDPVNIAARLQAAAAPGGILISGMVRDLCGSQPYELKSQGVHRFKNIAHPVETLSVVLEPEKDTGTDNAPVRGDLRFCKTPDGVTLAWECSGEGEPIIKAPNWIGHLDLDWRSPGIAPMIRSVSRLGRLVRFDARGNGLSDWDVDQISFDRFVDDLECVFDAAGVERAPILAISQGGAVAAAFAARAPERVSAIVMLGSFPLGRAQRNNPQDRARAEALRSMMRAGWDDEYPSLRDHLAQIILPGASIEDRDLYAADMRQMISPENAGRYREVIDNIDVTHLLKKVTVPCLVLHSRGDRMQPFDQGRKLAAGLPNSKFVALDSDNHILPEYDMAWPQAEREISNFLKAHV